MFAWLLNLVYLSLLVVGLPLRWILRRKGIAGWRQKILGQVPARENRQPCLWVHAVSVGEVVQIQPVLDQLARTRPELDVVVSTTTATGYEVARQRYPDRLVFYFPLDFSWAVQAALERIRPTAIALVELELWPNFIFAAHRRGIPLALINGRITERSHRGYSRIRPLLRALLRRIDVLAVQSDTYARRLADLGAEPSRLQLTGSIKFDGVEFRRDNVRTSALREHFGIATGDIVFIAGSTQDPEERLALEAYLALRGKYPRLRLLLVPRHKERFAEVAQLVSHEFGLPLWKRTDEQTSGPPRDRPTPVLLLDTLGELSACWGLADIAFVGGSLTQRGGQNMIEPAGYGAALMFGPNTWNFKDVVELLLSHDAARVVHSGAELTTQLDALLSDAECRAALGMRARDLVAAQRGATERTVELLQQILPQATDWCQRVA